MNTYIVSFFLLSTYVIAFPSYTGYSGAPGSKGTCASFCHGNSTGTITVTGFPAIYEPGKTYTISVQHSGGSTISNFNASTRKGSTTTGAGTFGVVSNTAVYTVSGYENGVRASSNNIDNASFTWIAPAAGTGDVILTLAGLQGSKSGPNTKIVLTSKEQNATTVNRQRENPTLFSLEQNYPNPFNPSTTVTYSVPVRSNTTISVFDVTGKEVALLVNEVKEAGIYSVHFDASGLSGGAYIYRLRAGTFTETRRMLLVK